MLETFDEEYKQAKAPEGGGGTIPDGPYDAVIARAEIKVGKSGSMVGVPMLSWGFKITGPVAKGMWVFKNSFVKSDQLGYLKNDLKMCGLELAQFSDLEDRCEELIGVEVKITVKTNGDFQNVYINKAMTQAKPLPTKPDSETPPF